jgi:uncharacterized protein YtpQ (UPF0354 family)
MKQVETRQDWLRRARPYVKRGLDAARAADVSLNPDDIPVVRDFAEGLVIFYLVDDGESFTYVERRDLAEAEMSDDELHRVALGNLYELARHTLRIQPTGEVITVLMEGNFEASVLLLDTVWDVALASHVQGEFIAAVPSRDVLAFGDSTSQGAVKQLRAVIKRVYRPGADHLVSDRLYRRHLRTWVRYDV